ncbi:hypothetical protein E2C01_035812 [Portunus trituberculatus]|uniref:Uncharacterized protein n=1 Tax=Portunus trituberculatus TaxID=210409 RepID=A0A5B7F9G5_PORTR|nr:hypothetical protein [Portunus trituberculatus]
MTSRSGHFSGATSWRILFT